MTDAPRFTLIGGPTLLLELEGFRLLTDPTFDPPGDYPGPVHLEKRTGPAVAPDALGRLDAVLLSHDQHADNLDRAGRELLRMALAPPSPHRRAEPASSRGAARVLTTREGAGRLPGAAGLAPWERTSLRADGRTLHVTATPARHGPPGIEPLSGPVTGFVLTAEDGRDLVWISGDTVWFEGTAEVARRFHPEFLVLFTGRAQTRGPFHVTMDGNDALEAAAAFPGAQVIAVHNEGWAHYTESEGDLRQAFAALGQAERLWPLERGRPWAWPAPRELDAPEAPAAGP